MEAREELIGRAGIPTRRPKPPEVERLWTRPAPGLSITQVQWSHGTVDGDVVRGLWILPEPVPAGGSLPLLVNVHGHWEAGVEADEVLYRSELFARQGWAVLSVSGRGTEHGDGAVPAGRAVHFSDGLYAEMVGRRAGATPLAWDVVAAWGGIDAALAGRMGGGVVVDSDVVAVAGFSGGAERATLVGATDPRVGGMLLGSYEYAFGSHDGTSSCSCGALSGGHDKATVARWLGVAACRPGAPPRGRPALAWDGQPQLGMSGELEALGVVVRPTPNRLHGINHPMAAASWAFLEARLRGGAVDAAAEDRARAATSGSWTPIDPAWRTPLPDGLPQPGLTEQAGPPWKVPVRLGREAAATLLGVAEGADPGIVEGEPWVGLGDLHRTIHRAEGTPDGTGWVVVAVKTPAQEGDGSVTYVDPTIAGMAPDAFRRFVPGASVAVVWPRTSGAADMDERVARMGAERGIAPLGIAVRDALDAADELARRPEVDPERIGFVGVGAGGVAAAWAAVIRGGDEPVVLVDAPVTLHVSGDALPVRPWPVSLLQPIRQGAALDPWMAADALGRRVRWVDPRGGDALPWTGRSPPGAIHPDVPAALGD